MNHLKLNQNFLNHLLNLFEESLNPNTYVQQNIYL